MTRVAQHTLADAALRYAEIGWPVLPLHTITGDGCSCGRGDCSSPGKHPRLQHGLKDASVDVNRIVAWWGHWPTANIGLVTGIAFDVLDIDGVEGIANFKNYLDDRNAELPAGPRSYTGGGGRHILFHPTGHGNRAGIIPKVDWRGRNGYIVAPPSGHRSGHTYQWRFAHDLELPSAPDFILDLLSRTADDAPVGERRTLPADAGDGTPYGRAALEGELRELGRAPQGERNHTLNRVAYRLFRFCEGGELRDSVVEQRLRDAAISIGLSDHEATQTIASARAGAAGKALNAPPSLRLVQGAGHSTAASTNGALALHSDDTAPTIDQALIDGIRDEYGVSGPDAWKLAEHVTVRVVHERTVEYARKLIRDERLTREADLDTIRPLTANQLLDLPRPPRLPIFGQLLYEGHNATVVARWKVGKSTFVDNASISAAGAGLFLSRFETPEPLRVCLFNYELHDDDMTDRLAAYNIPHGVADNITIINLRGRRLPLLTSRGRDAVVRILNDCGAQLWIVDPFGAAYAAAGGDNENDNAQVRNFLIGLDEIKRLSGCPTLIMPVHTGRLTQNEGDEQGRGATVLEDWPDVRILLTKDKNKQRFVRTEGRAWELDESRLTFDTATHRLSIAGTDLGVNRRRARNIHAARIVADVVAEHPALNKTDLRSELSEVGITHNSDKDDAITAAKAEHLIHVHGGGKTGTAHHHYAGPVHPDSDPCPGGWTP